MNPRHRQRRARRTGAAAVEFAVCLPVLVLLVMASIEACNMIFLDHTLSISAYEGVRVAIHKDANNAAVTARCDEILTSREVAGTTITLTPTDVAAVPRGQTLSVTVAAPCDANAMIPPWFFGGKTLSSTITMVKE